MGEGRATIDGIKDLDLIFAKPTRGTKMKIVGFFITEDTKFNFLHVAANKWHCGS
jgi:hypothetical protein